MILPVAWWLAVEAAPALRAPRLGGAEIQALARRRLSGLLRAAAATPFHGERFRGIGWGAAADATAPDPMRVLRALPPLSKAELRDAGTTALVGGRVRPGWSSTRSSGSTGEPFRVWYDARGWALHKRLVPLRARALCGVAPHHRIAVVEAIPPESEGRSLPERAGRVRRISAFRPAEEVAAALAAFRPHAVYGLASALLEAARALPAAGPRPIPKVLFTSGELLQPSVRRALAAAYRCPVLDVYGTSETKEIAWECARGGAHVNADVLMVEVLDESGRSLPPAEEGAIVVTVLGNRAMPLLRYRTGDRGSLLPGRCDCGSSFPLLGVVTGREAEHLELVGGRRLSPYVLTCALERVVELLRYQVLQLGPDRLRVRVRVPPLEHGGASSREATAARVRAAVREATGLRLEVEVEFVERFEAGPTAKFRVVQPGPVAGARADDPARRAGQRPAAGTGPLVVTEPHA